MDYLPKDPAILVSSVNMLLRDEEFDSLESLCYAFSRETKEIKDYLMNIKLKIIEETFSVCKVKDYSEIDLQAAFVFVGSTDEEKSLVCPTRLVPANTTERDDGWRAFRIEGVLDFSLIGILAKISTCLANNKIGIFAISTFNTDYILTKAENFEKAVKTLEAQGYKIC